MNLVAAPFLSILLAAQSVSTLPVTTMAEVYQATIKRQQSTCPSGISTVYRVLDLTNGEYVLLSGPRQFVLYDNNPLVEDSKTVTWIGHFDGEALIVDTVTMLDELKDKHSDPCEILAPGEAGT